MHTSSLLAILLTGFLSSTHSPSALQQRGEDPELAAARAKLDSHQEEECQAGVEICVRKNDVPAVELLLDVLSMELDRIGYLPSAHFRDIVWKGLERITDLYARQRIADELRMNKDSALMREWCAELLGEYRVADFGPGLVAALDDKEIEVARAAALALGKLRYAPAAKDLLKKIKHKDTYLRADAIEALARIDAAANRALFQVGLADKDGGVRCALLGSARELYGSEIEALSIVGLADEDWRPRLQAVDNLGAVRTTTSIDALVRALDDGRPTVAARASLHLQGLTGQKHTRPDSWKAWWSENREGFVFPDGSDPAPASDEHTTVAYHDIQIVSDHVAFLIDRSDEMASAMTSRSETKAAAALAELEGVLEKLQGRLTFNVFLYAESVEPLSEKGPIALTPQTKKKALQFVSSSPMGSSKDIWQLLETLLADPDIDTAYLLSSGEPDIGTYVHSNRLVPRLRELNRFHKLVIHAIAFSSNSGYRDQVKAIAEATGGEFRWFE